MRSDLTTLNERIASLEEDNEYLESESVKLRKTIRTLEDELKTALSVQVPAPSPLDPVVLSLIEDLNVHKETNMKLSNDLQSAKDFVKILSDQLVEEKVKTANLSGILDQGLSSSSSSSSMDSEIANLRHDHEAMLNWIVDLVAQHFTLVRMIEKKIVRKELKCYLEAQNDNLGRLCVGLNITERVSERTSSKVEEVSRVGYKTLPKSKEEDVEILEPLRKREHRDFRITTDVPFLPQKCMSYKGKTLNVSAQSWVSSSIIFETLQFLTELDVSNTRVGDFLRLPPMLRKLKAIKTNLKVLDDKFTQLTHLDVSATHLVTVSIAVREHPFEVFNHRDTTSNDVGICAFLSDGSILDSEMAGYGLYD